MRIKVKPLSVNEVWQGKRFKTGKYKDYETEVMYLLPKLKIPEGKLEVKITYGLSSRNSDIDNPTKPFLDILQKAYRFNDKNIYQLLLRKEDVKKGKEYVDFDIRSYPHVAVLSACIV